MVFGDAGAYDRFMGRFSEPLATEFSLVVRDVRGRVLDVGCGPGALTAVLARRYSAGRVDAIDPTPGFVEATRARLPEVDVRVGAAEDLPYADGAYEVAFAQLVVHFMRDPVRGLSEMARVARGGLVTRVRVGTTAAAAGRCRCSGTARGSSTRGRGWPPTPPPARTAGTSPACSARPA